MAIRKPTDMFMTKLALELLITSDLNKLMRTLEKGTHKFMQPKLSTDFNGIYDICSTHIKPYCVLYVRETQPKTD